MAQSLETEGVDAADLVRAHMILSEAAHGTARDDLSVELAKPQRIILCGSHFSPGEQGVTILARLRRRGLELLARQAEQAVSTATPAVVAANKSAL